MSSRTTLQAKVTLIPTNTPESTDETRVRSILVFPTSVVSIGALIQISAYICDEFEVPAFMPILMGES